MRNFLFLGLLCLAAAGPTSKSENVHELMTDKEVIQVFRTERHAVPEYEVVPIHFPRLHKRSYKSATKLRIKAFGQDFKLWLNPIEGVLVGKDTPVYLARSLWYSVTGEPDIKRVANPMANVGKMLEDLEKQATMIVKKLKNGKNSISGTIGDERLVIKPLPERINHHYNLRRRRSVNDVEFLQNITMEHDEPHYHVVYKLPERDPKAHSEAMPKLELPRTRKAIRSTPTLRVPKVIYPEILIFVDYESYKIHGKDMDELLEYMLPFWNGVDLRYRSLQSPKIRFNIAGIVIAEDAGALPFISRHMESENAIYVHESLWDFFKFTQEMVDDFPDNSYDIAITMTPYTMCAMKENASMSCGILGSAYTGRACIQAKNAIVMDHGAFDGIHNTAHEIGHLFGVLHDGENCTAADGHIMDPYRRHTHNMVNWSACSLRHFDNFFKGRMRGSNPRCLFNKPKTTHPLPRVLPGRVLTANQQCQRMFGTKSCDLGLKEKDRCIRLPCLMKGTRKCMVKIAPADGTICAPEKICIHGKCVAQSAIL